MSLNKEIEEQDEIRQKAGEHSRAHYGAIELPGDRRVQVDAEAARERIAAMRKEREAAGQGDAIK